MISLIIYLFKIFLAGFGSGSGFTTHFSITQCLYPHSLIVTGSSFISDCEFKSSFVYCCESGYSFLPIFSICLFVCLQASAELWPYFRLILSGEVLFRDRWDWSTLSPLYRTQVRDTQVTEYTFCPARCYPGTGETGPLSLHCTVRSSVAGLPFFGRLRLRNSRSRSWLRLRNTGAQVRETQVTGHRVHRVARGVIQGPVRLVHSLSTVPYAGKRHRSQSRHS